MIPQASSAIEATGRGNTVTPSLQLHYFRRWGLWFVFIVFISTAGALVVMIV